MRVALYARVSSEDQAEKYGLPSQLRAMKESARLKKYEIHEEYVDDGYTGADLDRPALQKLRKDAKNRLFDVVLSYEPDRLSRKLLDLLILDEEFRHLKILVDYVTIPAAKSDEEQMFFQIKGVFAEFERKKIRERTQRGKREVAAKGLMAGGRVAYGYRSDKGVLSVVPEQAVVVHKVFVMYASGLSAREITRYLNESGIRPWKADTWGTSSVKKMLKNVGYTGKTHQNRITMIDGNGGGSRHNKKTREEPKPESEWIPIEWPRIIEPDLYATASERFLKNKIQKSGAPTHRYLLRGLLFCGYCGRRMQGTFRREYIYYRCQGCDTLQMKSTVPCRHSVAAKKIEAAVWAKVRECYSDEKMLRVEIEKHYDRLRQRTTADNLEAERMKCEIDRLKKSEGKAARALLDPDLDGQYDFFRAQLTVFGQKLKALEVKLSGLVQDREVEIPKQSDIRAMCRSVRGILATTDDDRKREAMAFLVESVTKVGDDLEIKAVLPWAQAEISRNRPLDVRLVANSTKRPKLFTILAKVA